MASLGDVLKTSPVPALGVGLLALAIPVAFPSLRPQWAAAVKAGARLFFEAEGGAEAEIVGRIAEKAIDALVDAIAQDTPKARDEAVAAAIAAYKTRAHARSKRLAWDDGDRDRRYRHHMSKLRHAVARRHAAATGDHRKAWGTVVARLAPRHPAGEAQTTHAASRSAGAEGAAEGVGAT